MPFVHFFLIDVSYNAVTSGALEATCSVIARVLDELQGVQPPPPPPSPRGPPLQLLLYALLLHHGTPLAVCSIDSTKTSNTASMQLQACSHEMHSGLCSFEISLHS